MQKRSGLLLVAFAPHLVWLLAGRVLLGIALGGFWALSAATAMRLVPQQDVPRALSLLFTGVPIATIAAAALGSYLGDLMGWRNVFLLAAALSLVTLVVQAITLPRMPPQRPTPLSMLIRVMRRPGIGGVVFGFTGVPGVCATAGALLLAGTALVVAGVRMRIAGTERAPGTCS